MVYGELRAGFIIVDGIGTSQTGGGRHTDAASAI
jgi:hypothetical protein